MPDSTQKIVNLPIDHLQPNPLQPRGKMDQEELQDLVNSIKQHGVLEPLVAAHTPAGFQIIAGERRWKASKLAGLQEVPVIVRETDPRGMLEMAIIENVQRVDLNCLDRAKAFKRLMDEFRLEAAQVAERIGKSASYISNSLRLLTLPDALKDGLLSHQITEGHARALASIEDTRHMVEAYKQVLRENANVRRTEEIARRKKSEIGIPERGENKAPRVMSPVIFAMERKLMESFGEKSKINIIRSRAQTKITFLFKGDPEATQAYVNKVMKLAQK